MGKRVKSVSSAVSNFLNRVTKPVRNSAAWKFLRRTVLRSPFKGYFVKSWQELRQVQWPNRKTSWKLTATVIAFSVIFAIFTTVIDLGFERVAKQIFLK